MTEQLQTLFKQKDLITITVKPNAKENKITLKNDHIYISVKAPAIDNKANEAVITLIKKTLRIKVELVRGLQSKTKVVKVIT